MTSLLISTLSSLISTVVDKAIPDKDKANEIKLQLLTQVNSLKSEELKGAVSIITAEATGQSWLQRNWRPILMLVFVFIIANNYILYPYISLFFPGKALLLVLPNEMWELLKIGVGGYIVGRSAEKVADTYRKK